jgi:hypothetical protein
MAIGDNYITRDELKKYLKLDLSNTDYDDDIDDACTSASREVEQYTGRQFNKDTVPSIREFDADGVHSVTVDDFWTNSGLTVEVDLSRLGDYNGISAFDYTLYPLNGIVDGSPGWPYYRLDVPYWILSAGEFRAKVRVTAQWGWTAVPATVKSATKIIAAQTFRLSDAPFGVAGSDQFGAIRVRDIPQAATKLRRFILDPIKVG